MPARVHALVVVRADSRTAAVFHLRRSLSALAAQTRKPDALTIVVCGDDPEITEELEAAGNATVVTEPAHTPYADATARVDVDGDALWLLAQDTAPHPEALERLAAALEVAPSVAFVAPKLVRWSDTTTIVSLGVSMTPLGRTVGLADGELDQGQHDADDDVLGADVRGILVRTAVWEDLRGLDPGLHGADEGLDLGVRARLAGLRVSLVPAALIAVAGDGVAGVPAPVTGAGRFTGAYEARVAQLHRRLTYARPAVAPLQWLALLPVAVWLTVVHLVRKQPSLVAAEWAATATVLVALGSVARARGDIRSTRRVSWALLAPLRVRTLRHRLDGEPEPDATSLPRGDLRFFSGGAAWLVLAALLAGVIAFPALLAWPVLGGGGLQPLSSTVGQLWANAAYGQRALGLDTIAPADPFAAVMAVIGTLSPFEPSRAIVVLWVLALPLAALGGWFAATRVTDRAPLRLAGGVGWALAPTFLAALGEGRPGAVLAHLLLPWLFAAASIAHRSWVPAGAASLLFAAVVACAPSLGPALGALWVLALVLTIVLRGRGTAFVVWIVVPAAALWIPVIWRQVRTNGLFAILADPGMPWAGPQVAADPAGRALLAAGFPTADPGGWNAFLGTPAWWVPLLAAPIALLALVAPFTQRWFVGILLLVVAGVGIATAFAAVAIFVTFADSLPVPLWPGAGLSLAWLGALGGSIVALDAGFAPWARIARNVAGASVVLALMLLAVPTFSAFPRGETGLGPGQASTLPAYVAAEGRDDPDIGTVVVTPQNGGGLAATVVWGSSETLDGQSTIVATRTRPNAEDVELAALTADLVTPAATGVSGRLAALGASFVLLAPAAEPESDIARAQRLEAQAALDQRDGLDSIGETPRGILWRVTTEPSPRPEAAPAAVAASRIIATLQLIVVGAAVLLALPTAASRRAARYTSRVVGPYWEEGR